MSVFLPYRLGKFKQLTNQNYNNEDQKSIRFENHHDGNDHAQ